MTVRDTCALLLTLATVRAARPTQLENAFSKGDLLDVAVYVSATPRFVDFNSSDALIWAESSIPYDIVETRTANVKVPLTEHLLSNGTLYAHAFFTKQGASPDPKRSSFDRWATTGATIALVGHDAMLKPLGLYHLLTGEPAPWEAALRQGAADAVAAGRDGVYVSYWKPSLLLQLIVDEGRYEQGTMPHAYEMYLRHYRNVQGRRFRPLLYVNELTLMKQHWIAINRTAAYHETALPLDITVKPLPAHRFQWMVNLQNTIKSNEEMLGISEKESEDMRGMFVNTNPTLLYTTIAVSALHLLFDMLAFKNDVSFWRSVDTMEGLSARTLVMNQVMEVVILLYLVEQDASWLVKITSILSLVLGVFKIAKSFRVRKLDAAKQGGGESLTDHYDKLAFRYLSPPLLLAVVGYSGHSLWYGYHRGWYAWILECMVALVYGGGFIVMTPQLFINYRLKSVAHLPWRFFMYKALNTFIDDLFAFIIKMPTMHRMSCFRDDIVFAVFLYQRWVYKVDMSRVNEFGHRGEGEGKDEASPVGDATRSTATDTDSAEISGAKKKRTKKTQ